MRCDCVCSRCGATVAAKEKNSSSLRATIGCGSRASVASMVRAFDRGSGSVNFVTGADDVYADRFAPSNASAERTTSESDCAAGSTLRAYSFAWICAGISNDLFAQRMKAIFGSRFDALRKQVEDLHGEVREDAITSAMAEELAENAAGFRSTRWAPPCPRSTASAAWPRCSRSRPTNSSSAPASAARRRTRSRTPFSLCEGLDAGQRGDVPLEVLAICSVGFFEYRCERVAMLLVRNGMLQH